MVERRFPLFVNLAGRKVLLFGGGPVALRAGQDACGVWSGSHGDCAGAGSSLSLFAGPAGAAGLPAGELRGAFLVLAATDDEEVNRAIAAEARARGALANNASDCRDCDFFFPAVVLTEELTLGLTGTGENHRPVKEARPEYGRWRYEKMHSDRQPGEPGWP